MIDLTEIRARDRDYDDVFEAQANMSKDIALRLVAWPAHDRRALLAYVDELRSRLAEAEAEHAAFSNNVEQCEKENDRLRKDAERWKSHAILAAKILWDWRSGYIPSADSEDLVAKIRADQSLDTHLEGGP